MLTPEQIADRPNKIGSSDGPKICGFFGGGYDLWLEKLGLIEPFAGNEATQAGDDLEPLIIKRAAKALGAVSFRSGVEVRSKEYPFITATLDAIPELPIGDPCIIEAKTGGIYSPLASEHWGEPETDEIPDHYMIQVQHQMFAAGPEYQFVALHAFIPPRGFVMYYVGRNEELIAAIVQKEIEFWDCVQRKIPPDGSPSMDAIKRMRRQPNKTVPIDETIIMAWLDAKAKAAEAKQIKDEIEAALLASLGDAEAGQFGDGQLVTYMETSRRAYSVEATKYRALKIKRKR